MRREKYLNEINHNKILKLSEGSITNNSTFVVVDIQPEYEGAFTFKMHHFCEELNNILDTASSVTILYNGEDTLGMISQNELYWWYVENGLSETKAERIRFYDKGYAFFRSCMDEGIDEEEITQVVKFMHQNNINDSRDITTETWDKLQEFDPTLDLIEVREYLMDNEDAIHVPDLMDEVLVNLSGRIVMCGGGLNECLKEVEIGLNALQKPYSLYTDYCY